MEEKFTFSPKLKYFSFALIAIGIITFIIGYMSNPDRAWANILIGNYYFLALAIGATFFLAIQYITQSGWSSAFKRIPEAMAGYIPIAAIIMLLMIFGMSYLYSWTHPHEAGIFDEHELHLLHHKAPYLNVPFFIARMVIYFLLWVVLTKYLRKLSMKEDIEGGLDNFKKSELYSKILIFVLAITFTFAAFDWLMSLEPIWFSTLFSVKNFISAFYHGSAVIVLIAILLYNKGYIQFLNKAHLHDFSKYIFMPAILFGYLWYSQYMLIWYANIPEETTYFITRRGLSQNLFVLNVMLNWAIPFVILLPNFLAKNKNVLIAVIIIILVGHYVDIYEEIMPGATGEYTFGFIEVGMFLGFAGLFIFSTALCLSKANLIPINHPYLNESLHHSAH